MSKILIAITYLLSLIADIILVFSIKKPQSPVIIKKCRRTLFQAPKIDNCLLKKPPPRIKTRKDSYNKEEKPQSYALGT